MEKIHPVRDQYINVLFFLNKLPIFLQTFTAHKTLHAISHRVTNTLTELFMI